MVANPTPDMAGSREQGVWFRFVQIECTGLEMAPLCKQIGAAQYWDTCSYVLAIRYGVCLRLLLS